MPGAKWTPSTFCKYEISGITKNLELNIYIFFLIETAAELEQDAHIYLIPT